MTQNRKQHCLLALRERILSTELEPGADLDELSLCETYGVNNGCFIGLQYPYTHWDSGVPVTYTNWYVPHFQNTPSIGKVWIYNTRRGIAAGTGRWDDIDGSNSESHICRLPLDGDVSGALGTTSVP